MSYDVRQQSKTNEYFDHFYKGDNFNKHLVPLMEIPVSRRGNTDRKEFALFPFRVAPYENINKKFNIRVIFLRYIHTPSFLLYIF